MGTIWDETCDAGEAAREKARIELLRRHGVRPTGAHLPPKEKARIVRDACTGLRLPARISKRDYRP